MSIFDDVLSFIDTPQERAFEELALRVFRYQSTNIPVYKEFLASRGVNPTAVTRIDAIPPMSTVAFKHAKLESQDEAASPGLHVFFTSGTTIGKAERGRHAVVHPEVYRASSISHLRRMLFPDWAKLAMLALHPTVERMAESSLSQMISWCIEEFGRGIISCVATREEVDVTGAITFLRERERRNQPVCLLATTSACAKLFSVLAKCDPPLELPVGSRLMDTGGPKGQVEPLSPAQVVIMAERLLAVSPEMVINEYGMTEMCSQLYDATSFNSWRSDPLGARVKLAPAWLQPFTLDPITLRPVPEGERGLLAFFDLANVGSVSMLLTEDVGIIESGAVRILGRSTATDPRGCALAITEFAARIGCESDL